MAFSGRSGIARQPLASEPIPTSFLSLFPLSSKYRREIEEKSIFVISSRGFDPARDTDETEVENITPAGGRRLKKSGISARALFASPFLCFPSLPHSSRPVVQQHFSLLGALYYCSYPLSSSRILPSSHLHTEPHRALSSPSVRSRSSLSLPKPLQQLSSVTLLLQPFDCFFSGLHSPSASRLLQNKRASSLFFPFRLIRWWIRSCLCLFAPARFSLPPPTWSLVLRQTLLTKHLHFFSMEILLSMDGSASTARR
ncbi:hypothetical protein BDW66DRAFT_104943 [Aspergillus desertorum]